jgi:hypothetical protein
MTVEVSNGRSKTSLETVVLPSLLTGICASFVVGYLLGEDSIGGMRFDAARCHWPLIERFSTTSWVTAIAKDYCTANNPLLYMIASLLPLHDDQRIYHAITFSVAFLIWPLLAWAYHRRYSKYGIDWLWALFGASAILISPGFRSSAFWGDTDYLPFLFCAGTSLLISEFQDSGADKARAMSPFTLVALGVVSSCAFYIRQYYAFVPAFAAWTVITRTKTSPLLVCAIFLIAALPEMYLIYLWKGFNAPDFQRMFSPGVINIAKTGAILGLLSLPVIVGSIRRSLGDVLPRWWGMGSTLLASAGLLLFIVALRTTEWPESGGGIIVKAGLEMGALGTPFILTFSYFGLLAAIIFSTRSATNGVLAGAFLLPFFVASPTYQRYLEPALVVTLYLFADAQTARTIFNRRTVFYNFALSSLILAIGIVYYDFFNHRQ